MQKIRSRRFLAVLLTLALAVSLFMMPVSASWTMEEMNPNPNSAAVYGQSYPVQAVISLAAEQNGLCVTIPTSLSAAQLTAAIAADSIQLSLVRNDARPYLDPALYPNQTAGGELSAWMTQGNAEFFSNVKMSAEADGALKVTFDTAVYFVGRDGKPDSSAPHSAGGAYLDLCGYFTLCATTDTAVLGGADVKVAPYVDFHTMDEIYVAIDEVVKTGIANGLYVVKCSMGQSTAGRDMPYIIVADSKSSVDAWLALTELAETQPTQVLADIEAGKYDDIRVPVLFSNIHSNEVAASDGVMEFAEMITSQSAISYQTLTGFTEEGKAELAKEMGPVGEAGSVAVPDLVKDSATYLGYLTVDNNGRSGKVDLDKYYTSQDNEIKVADLLKDVFFILVPEENVDGRTYVTRASSNGYDLNRDNSFQTTSETMNMQAMIGTFNPVSFAEFHGRVTAFQCEPCDPPHEPNFEYDLLAEHLVPGGEALGIAAVANNDEYNSYVIPQRDYLVYTGNGTETYWADPWDDMSTSYTPQFAMLHGCVAYTVELPAYCDSTAQAVRYGILGNAAFVAADKLGYLADQVKIYERGTVNFNSNAYELVGQWLCDQYDVEGAEMDVFRPEFDGADQNGNFYPECYIIPMDAENQSNLQAAADMMIWLARNDVKVNVATESFTYDGVTYPAGTMIISMYQAKRSVANGALYKGTLIQGWTVLYSEGITSFNETRGFDMATVAEPAAFEAIKAVMGEDMDLAAATAYVNANVAASFSGVTGYDVIISNASEASTAAVNALLKAGKTVGMITEGKNVDDFICSYADYLTIKDQYVITATGVVGSLYTAQVLAQPVVYLTGAPRTVAASGFAYNQQVSSSSNWNYDNSAMKLMGFQTTETLEEGTVIVGATAPNADETAAVKSGVPYIGYGSSATATRATGAISADIVRTGLSGSMDLKAYVTYPSSSLITASYISDMDNVMYGYGYGYFTTVPDDALVLVRVDGSKVPTEGFIPTNTEARAAAYEEFMNSNGILGFAYQADGMNIALFANSLTHKVHQRDEYALISNFIFMNSMTDEAYAGAGTLTDVSDSAYYADAVAWAIVNGITNGKTPTTFNPDDVCTRAEAVTFLWRAYGCPEAEATAKFVDVEADAYYSKAVAWAVANGVTDGVTDTTFCPYDTCTRAQIITLICRAAKASTDAIETPFTDIEGTEYFASAVAWGVENGIVCGMTETTFCPYVDCTRAQIVTFLYRCMK